MLGNQLYGPYGNQLYQSGSLNTNKGYTGQYADPLSGLDYYNARYYDPVVASFLSADTVQGNMQGMDPYTYVGQNPETLNDPTGERFISPGGQQAPLTSITTSSPYSLRPTTAVERLAIAYQNLLNPGSANGLPLLLNAFLYDHNSWITAESYAEYQLHSSLLYLLGKEAWYLVHDSGINWNASVADMHMYLRLNGLAMARQR
jgi:RHS repeat-associated protein